MKSVAVHITIPEELLEEVDRQAEQERRNRSELTREALRRYLARQQQKALAKQQLLGALQESAGSWTDETHPELTEREDPHRLREALWEADQRKL
ncbi:MAG TPA: ribbon-helix-helix protein, CopG family, partial [Candidatus Fraserbacteria bacterium]|nr:ribbon-helix-helix protein, CopG family [Candidatus Fraserbacteria bacterium]